MHSPVCHARRCLPCTALDMPACQHVALASMRPVKNTACPWRAMDAGIITRLRVRTDADWVDPEDTQVALASVPLHLHALAHPEWVDPDWEDPEWVDPDWEDPNWVDPDWEDPDWVDPDWEDLEWVDPDW
eukprot:359108-Chlamydomonas_euryale.AAC.4